MKVGFIGKGRVAQSFAKYLQKFNVEILGFVDRQYANACILGESDIVFVATTDDNIECAAKKIPVGDNIVCHFSGSLTSDVLGNHKNRFSLHPAMTILGDYIDFSKVAFTLEGAGNRERLLEFLATVKISAITIEKSSKVAYHTALCNCANHLATLMYSSQKIMESSGIPADKCGDFIYPLAMAALNNCRELTPLKALTGPIVRGDVATLEKHMPYADNVYKNMAAETAKIACENGNISVKTRDDILKLLCDNNINGK